MRWLRSSEPKPPSRIELEFVDRHAEHADGRDDLCEHGRFDLWPGDSFTGKAMLESTVVAEVEIHYLDRGKLRVVLNQLSYLIERRVEQAKRDAA